MSRRFLFLAVWGGLSVPSLFPAAPETRALVPGVRLVLVAEHPMVATPTGIDADAAGRIWVVNCHTHMPAPDYPGPKRDEVVVLGPDGSRTLFHDQTRHTMDLELGPDGWVYLAERSRLLRLRDADGDGRADTEETLATLETEADYPHNALAGLAWHPDGSLWFGLGENYAKAWTLTGSDDVSFAGTGEGGIFRMRPDGSGLGRVARGMWNPFAVCVRDDGEVFAADNDPGESPPCRLLHVVDGADFGYQRAYGSEARHPFVGWNGQLRGTLPMVLPTGEAPCGVAALGNGLLIPSWSDHRIDFFPLRRQGAGFASRRVTVIQGPSGFRPTCLARERREEPGRVSWVLADWVDGSYPVHGQGRVWRLELDLAAAAEWVGPMALEPPTASARLAAALRSGALPPGADALRLAADPDPYLAQAALRYLALSGRVPADPLLALLVRRVAGTPDSAALRAGLADPDPEVQFEALRAIADGRMADFLPDVDAFLAREDVDFRRFEAALAARNVLAGQPETGVRNADLLLAKVQDGDAPATIRAWALRLLPDTPRQASLDGSPPRKTFPKGLTLERLDGFLASAEPVLALEAARALAANPVPSASRLVALAEDPARHPQLRAEAVAGLRSVAPDHVERFVRWAGDSARPVREEALRGLRVVPVPESHHAALRAVAEQHPEAGELVRAVLEPGSLAADRPAPDDLPGWLRRLDAVPGAPDVEAGRRLFHGSGLARCGNCHRKEGRGQVVGPDLDGSAGADRAAHLASILDPNAAIAPEFLPRLVELKDGSSFVGIRLRSSTQEVLRDLHGQNRSFPKDDVIAFRELETSFMPPGLALGLTDGELRDLLAYLATP
jgi:putative membrane-bound dehydrogenase-like protein